MNRFENKIVVITGGASGFGRATAYRIFSEEGEVIIVDRDRPKGEDVVNTIAAKGGKASFVEADLSDYGSIKGYSIRNLYRLMYMPEIWYEAYANIYSNDGAITPVLPV